jgi:hypothetical protein
MKTSIRHWWSKLRCALRGHDFGPEIYLSPSVLQYCRRGCGQEICGRTWTDLEPLSEADIQDICERMDEIA